MTMASNKIGSLEDQAKNRRLKLLYLKRKRENHTESNTTSETTKDIELLPTPLFRSYKPADGTLHENIIGNAAPEDVTNQVKGQIDSAKSEMVIDQLDVTSLAPRKPDWDLKRDISKKVEKLEKQTQKAIAELIRERLKERKEDDLAAMVNAGTTET